MLTGEAKRIYMREYMRRRRRKPDHEKLGRQQLHNQSAVPSAIMANWEPSPNLDGLLYARIGAFSVYVDPNRGAWEWWVMNEEDDSTEACAWGKETTLMAALEAAEAACKAT
jgi:hypothetical protein